jgi:hypothetical protein
MLDAREDIFNRLPILTREWSDDVDASTIGVSEHDIALLLPHVKARSVRNANYHDWA